MGLTDQWLVEKRALTICSLCSVYLHFFFPLKYNVYLCVCLIFNHWFMGLFTVSIAVSFFSLRDIPQHCFSEANVRQDGKMTCLQATMWSLFMFHQPLKTSQRCSAVRTYKAFLFPRRLCMFQSLRLRFKYICNSCGHFCVLLLPHTYEFSPCLQVFDFSFMSSICPEWLQLFFMLWLH